jgi:hypothetical protein
MRGARVRTKKEPEQLFDFANDIASGDNRRQDFSIFLAC